MIWPDGAVEFWSATALTLVKPRFCSCVCAALYWLPTTLGRLMAAVPEETVTVTGLPFAALFPLSGVVLVTLPPFWDELACWTATGLGPAASICAFAVVQLSPLTRGTLTEEPLPPFSRMTATMIAATSTTPAMSQPIQRRPPPLRCSISPPPPPVP